VSYLKWMILAVLALVLLWTACVTLSGCGVVRNTWVGFKAGTVMLRSTITLYTCEGRVIEKWETRAKVESNGGEAWWVDDAGVQHHIAGTFTVEGR